MHTTSRIALLSMLTVIMTMGVAHAAPKGVESYALLIGEPLTNRPPALCI